MWLGASSCARQGPTSRIPAPATAWYSQGVLGLVAPTRAPISCYVQVGVQIIVGPNARLGTIKAATVTGRDGSRTDLVKARVRVVS